MSDRDKIIDDNDRPGCGLFIGLAIVVGAMIAIGFSCETFALIAIVCGPITIGIIFMLAMIIGGAITALFWGDSSNET